MIIVNLVKKHITTPPQVKKGRCDNSVQKRRQEFTIILSAMGLSVEDDRLPFLLY